MGGSVHQRHDAGDFFARHDHGDVDLLVDAHGIDAALHGVAEVADGLVLDRWDINRGQIAGAQEPRQLARITSIGCDTVARLFRNQ